MGDIIQLRDIEVSPDEKKQMTSIHGVKQLATKLAITDQSTYEKAADMIANVSNRLKNLEAMRKKMKAPTLEAGRLVDELFKIPLKTGKDAKTLIQTKMLDYVNKVEREKKIIEQATQNEAIKQQEQVENEALELLDQGNDEAAQKLLDNLDVMPKPMTIVESAYAAGISTRANWKCRIVDLNKLVSAIASGKAPLDLVTLDQSVANKYAKAVRNTLKIDGLEFYNDVGLSVRRK
jgi:hypothetical protein